MNEIKEKECIVCLKTFEYKTEPRRATKVYRGKNMVCCSKRCSKVYTRVAHYIYMININKKLKEKREKDKKERKIKRLDSILKLK